MNELRENIEAGVEAMLEHMREDYRGWSRLGETDESGIRARMSEEYADELSYTTGSKYIKVTSKNSVSAFVVNTTSDKKFSFGDILKPAGWAAPARNFARGNVLDRTFCHVRWTGARQKGGNSVWLEYFSDTEEVDGSSPSRPTINYR